MRRWANVIAVGAVVLTVLGASAMGEEAEPAKKGRESGSAAVFREHQITDPGLNGMVAATVLVPEDWTVEGGLTRNGPKLYSMPVAVDLRVTGPDGRRARFFPSLSFEFNVNQPAPPLSPTLGGNLYMPLPESAGAWFLSMAQAHPDPGVSDLRLVSEAVEPALTEQLRQQHAAMYQLTQQSQATAGQTGISMAFDTQATRIVLAYTQDGRAYEETVLMTWQYLVTRWQDQVVSGNWSIGLMRSARGPAGSDYLNDPQLMTIFRSVRNNPQWDAEMGKYWAELARIRNQGARDRMAANHAAHQKRMQTMNETSDIIMNGWKQRQAVQDAGHERTIDAIHEVTPYQTPAGQTVKLPSFYDHVYTDGNGRYLLNNDSLYDPNTDPGMNQHTWERIEPTR